LTLRRVSQEHNRQPRSRRAGDWLGRIDYSSPRPHNRPGVLPLPQVVLLYLKLQRVGGLQVLELEYARTQTKLLPVRILTSSVEHTRSGSGQQRRLL